MGGLSGLAMFLGLLFIAFVIFSIYFIFKILEFVIRAINLYEKMISGNDLIIKLLIDVRDGTKTYSAPSGITAPAGMLEPVFLDRSTKTFHQPGCRSVTSEMIRASTKAGKTSGYVQADDCKPKP